MANPNELNELQTRLARHALGLPNPHSKSYRNRYSCPSQGEDLNAWLGMAERGLATEANVASLLRHFELTLVGARAALQAGETLDQEDFPAA